VLAEYLKARNLSLMKKNTISKVCEKSGVDVDPESGHVTCNISRFSAADFATSQSTSTLAHLSHGYPAAEPLEALAHAMAMMLNALAKGAIMMKNPSQPFLDSHGSTVPVFCSAAHGSRVHKHRSYNSLDTLKRRLDRVRNQRNLATAHAGPEKSHIESIQEELNTKKKTSGERIVHTQSRIVTATEGREEEAEKQEKQD
ncbi:unnamed protein product, partial [Mycena citricolor]